MILMKKNNIIFILLMTICTISACKESTDSKESAGEPSTVIEGYDERHRPQFHFSPQEKWMNDPNGMVYYEGEYHLFYQYYPDSTVWGPMHWGHAVSRDMVHWQHLPVALYPDSLGYIFSGSAVVDRNNTSGFGKDGQPPLIAIFSYHDPRGEKEGRKNYQYQAIAYSNDKGRTWTKYEGNPVVPNTGNHKDFRDPKVMWDDDRKQWVMVMAAFDHIKFWGSPDLKKWTHLSDWGVGYGAHTGVWECPDLFPIGVGTTSESKWVLLVSINPGGPYGGSATQYFVGDFDGTKFSLDKSYEKDVTNGKVVWLDHGRDNYAGVTWSGIPKEDGRRLFLGWMSNWEYAQVVPTELWRSAMTLPRTLSLEMTDPGYRLFSKPVSELQGIRIDSQHLKSVVVSEELDLTKQFGISPTGLELELVFELPVGGSTDFGIELSNSKGELYRIGYNLTNNEFYSDRSKSGDFSFSRSFAGPIPKSPRVLRKEKIRFHFFIDAASIELFADEGANTMTEIFFPTEDFNTIKIYAQGGNVKLESGKAYPLKSIWKL